MPSPLLREPGTNKPVKARFWSRLVNSWYKASGSKASLKPQTSEPWFDPLRSLLDTLAILGDTRILPLGIERRCFARRSRGSFVADSRDYLDRLGPRAAMTFCELLPDPVISLAKWPVRGTNNRKTLFRQVSPCFFLGINPGRWRGSLVRSP